MLVQLHSLATIGMGAEKITVEIGSLRGEGKITIVGLGDTAVQESKLRVRHAVKSAGYRFPTGHDITVNLAPADLRKVGPRYDLPIALGLLIGHGLVDVPPETLHKTAFLGELALDGSLRHVSGILSAALSCKRYGIDTLVVPHVNGSEAALVPDVRIIAPHTLQELLDILQGSREASNVTRAEQMNATAPAVDLRDIRGQAQAKRALEIAAAGGHNLLLSGAPGAGKTLLARALPGILPPLSYEESLEVTQVYSVANALPSGQSLMQQRPFRMVHHTASAVSIVGGGTVPRPGEISLAHRGVLFLDELAEFPAVVLEVLRQPLEDRKMTITRAQGSITFPADVMLVAAMNPPEYGGSANSMRRISQPLLDRLDLTLRLEPVKLDELQAARTDAEPSSAVLARVSNARERQRVRFSATSICTNKEMHTKHVEELCPLNDDCLALMQQAAAKMQLSARGYHRTIKVARTIADLADCEQIGVVHLAEALQYRQAIFQER